MKRRSFIATAGAAALAPGELLHARTAGADDAPRTRKVFAHYMVAWPRDGKTAGPDQYAGEIRDAMAAGIDGFALNCGGWSAVEPYYKRRVEAMYDAADRFDGAFALFVSADGNAQDELEDIVRTVRGRRAQMMVNGRPMLSAYALGGLEGARAQSLLERAQRLGVYFVPHLFPHTGEREIDANAAADIVERIGPADGYFYFGAAGAPSLLARSTRALATALRDAGKAFMAPVTPYYRGLPQGTNYRAFETDGFAGMAEEWRAAIESRATWVQIVTWNDWAESTYVAPTGGARQAAVYHARFGPILSHEGYLRASRHYIRWFKTGSPPPVLHDELFYFYRLFPAASACAPPRMPQGTLLDRIFVCVLLAHPAQLTVRQDGRADHRLLPAGISFVDVPSLPGQPRFTIVRNGRIVLDRTGELAITERDFSSRYGYYSGWASGAPSR
ncbi:glycoside hydrolase family 71 protein [Burkholderia pseudomultivorans]|uniref:glycoside hydrolase family 71 protein n=1 Tax=Burkholderia pseudomultivorans TaxID=1207504 RepID=UPI00075C5827|nr:glycoside hydrolase family 71 protein [Burkholderia pseudomultivorans]KVC41056.1 glycoside hydrolase family 71 [Burkholderia pseudomultivorans]MDS0790659.1 glycoside hydrolase family 71 protein [Burkholderia pseudomultivorans]